MWQWGLRFSGESSECLIDCPSEGWDAYCEPLKDSICDPDCGGKDPNCIEESVENGSLNAGDTSRDMTGNMTGSMARQDIRKHKQLLNKSDTEIGKHRNWKGSEK